MKRNVESKSFIMIILVSLALVFCISFFCGFGVPSRASATAASVESSAETPFDREQIKIDNVILSANKLQLKASDSAILDYMVEPGYSAETITEVEYKVTSGRNYATVNNDGILSIFEDAPAYESVGVRALVNGVESNIVTIEIVKTPVAEFEISTDKTTIREGGTAQINVDKLLPKTASFIDVRYEITAGNDYASIDATTGKIQVADVVDNSSATIKVRALTCENYTKSSNEIEIAIYVPVKNMVLTASEYLAQIASTQNKDIHLSASAIGVVSDFDPIFKTDLMYRDYIDLSRATVVEGADGYIILNDKTLHIKSNLSRSVQIPVWATQDDAESNTIYIDIYIMAEQIELETSEGVTQISQFLSYDFAARTYPEYATAQQFTYTLSAANGASVDYAHVDKMGIISVGDHAPSGSKLRLAIKHADLTREIALTISEYNTQTIALLTDNLPSVVYPTEVVALMAILDGKFQTTGHCSVVFDSGDSGVFLTQNNTITIKSLTELESLGKNELSFGIRLKSINGKLSSSHTFTVKLPVASMQNQTINVDRGDTVYVDMKFNTRNFASNKNLKEPNSLILNGQKVIVRKSNIAGQLEILLPTKLRYGLDDFSFPVFSEDGNRTCTISVVLNKLDPTNLVANLDSVDSANYAINLQAPELWTGRQLGCTYTYKGAGGTKSVTEYGLTYSSISLQNATETTHNNERVILTANNTTSGLPIGYATTFYDGTTNTKYTLSRANIRIFNPASAAGAVYVANNSVTMNDVRLDLAALYGYNDTKDSPKKIWITTGGKAEVLNNNTLKVIASTPWSGFDAIIHYSQTYNGKVIEMGQSPLRVSIGFSKNAYIDYKLWGGDYDCDVMGINDEYGYYGGFLGIGNHDPRGSDDQNPSGGMINAGYKYIGNLFDWQKMREVGFTKIRFTLVADISEYADGWQELYVLCDNDAEARNGVREIWRDCYIEHGSGYMDESWWGHTFVFDVPIDTIIENPYLIMAAGAHGNGCDIWRWGWTRFDFEAVA